MKRAASRLSNREDEEEDVGRPECFSPAVLGVDASVPRFTSTGDIINTSRMREPLRAQNIRACAEAQVWADRRSSRGSDFRYPRSIRGALSRVPRPTVVAGNELAFCE